MDEVGARIQQQSSITSETNSEEHPKLECKCKRNFFILMLIQSISKYIEQSRYVNFIGYVAVIVLCIVQG